MGQRGHIKPMNDINKGGFALMEKMGQLYTITGMDWCLSANTILTEPVCPSASVYPEGVEGFCAFDAFGDSIEEAIERALDKAYRCLILGTPVDNDLPFTNPTDSRDEKLIAAWLRGEKPSEEDINAGKIP